MRESKCKGCGQVIFWVRNRKSGKDMPLETTMKIIVDKDGIVKSGYESHHAHCTHVDQFRKEKPE